jgi:hypothetical protein
LEKVRREAKRNLESACSSYQNTAAIRVSSIISQSLYYFLVVKYEENRKIGSGTQSKGIE